ncbi:Ig-like domain-containing protein [Bathymodiolus thermophilus thioautotrophic gill symbiont]|uniref:Bacterial Ig-like domain-containing protein n=1 Tax=Bathymodiolus thermophilus thioautotrophic gill symbiont TaxID=2360 RepID=A0A8H8X9Z8_9GAMM|nr:Ig-like domain-containing protein [Bathymodiolus thermophilus thioautotrophic gill symbiont]CAB5494264.1 hypothetical protein THERMOS_65 [Bathymodiolus thermophilus thioautotrophic gill symbiont]
MKNIQTKVTAQKQITTLQNKVQKVADNLNKEVITIAKGIQHIQTQVGVVYQLNTKDFDAKKLGLIAKKIGDDLEVALEEGVVIFDDYFEVCSTDVSCLVSLPTEDGGLYHVVADAFFTLEDGTQVVYFYGEQSIISTESSAIRASNNKGFYDTMEIASAIALITIAVSATGGNDDSDDGDDASDGDRTLITGDVNLGTVTGRSLKVQAFVNGTAISDKFIVDASGKFTITLNKSYNQNAIVTLKLTDTTDTADYIDEASGVAKDLNSDLQAIVIIQSSGTKVNITPLTDIAARIIIKETNITKELVINANIQVGKIFGISGNVTTKEVKTVLNKEGVITTSNAYGQALAVISQFEKDAQASDATIKTSDTNKKIADSISINYGIITNNGIRVKLRVAEVATDIKYKITSNDHFNNIQATKIMIKLVTTDNIINFSEKDNTSITGTVKAGSTVVLSINGRDKNASVSGTTWRYTLTNADITAIEGETISIIATATDANKKVTISDTRVITIDTIAPTFDLSLPTTINIATNTPITTSVYNAQATNLEGGNGIIYSLKEAASSKFKINADTGKVTYKTLQTSAHNNDTATIIATDNAGNTTEQLITVSVQDIGLTTSVVWGNISNNDNIIGTNDLTTATLSGTVFVTGAVDSISITSIIFKKNGNTVYGINTNLPNVDNNNTWTLTHGSTWTSKLINGDYTIVVNLSGNRTIEGSGTLTTTIDTIAPTQPTVTLTNGGDVTKDGAIIVSDLEPNGTRAYHLKKGNSKVASVTDETTYTAYMANADETTYLLTIIDTDNAGNASINNNTLAFTLDTTPPNSPIVILQEDSGLMGDNITNNGRLLVSNVSTEATFIVTKNNGVPLAAMTKEEYTAYITGRNRDGDYSVEIAVKDAVGNTSNAIIKFTLDTDVWAPTFSFTDTGSSNSDRITNNGTITIGNLESGSTWQYSTNAGTNFVSGENNSFMLNEGTYEINDIQVRQVDTTGNTSSNIATNTSLLIMDTTAPLFTSAAAINVEINTAISDTIYTAKTNDDLTSYFLKDENQGKKFTIGSDSGILRYVHKQTQKGEHQVTIIAIDIAGNEAEKVVHVSVIDTGLSPFHTNTTPVLNGDDNDNTLIGSLANELFVAGLGDDTLIGNGGTDVFNAGAGDDTIVINDDNLAKLSSNPLSGNLLACVDGGSNTDTLKLEGSNLNLDLTNIDNSRIQDIEIIDLTGSGNNTLKLNLNDLLDISSETNVLKVMGDSGDKVDIELNDNAFVRDSASETENGITYHIYSNANDSTAELWIDQDLGVM